MDQDTQLRDLYVNHRYSLRACARVFGTNHPAVKRQLQRMGVRIRTKGEQVEAPTKRLVPAMLHLHQEGLSGLQIARRLGVSSSTVCDRLKEQGIDKGWRHPETVCLDKRTASGIAHRYRHGESADAIGRAVGYSIHVVLKELKRRGFEIRSPHGDYRNRPDVWKAASQIVRLYRAGLSTLTIGERFRCCDDLICQVLKSCGVKFRGTWKGGQTSLAKRIRSLPEYWAWARQVRRRFNNTCVVSGATSDLHVHHLRPMSELIDRFLQTRAGLDPVRDVRELVQLARRYRPFFRLSNGVLLDRTVHREMVHVKGAEWSAVDIARAYTALGSVRAASRLLGISRGRVAQIVTRLKGRRKTSA